MFTDTAMHGKAHACEHICMHVHTLACTHVYAHVYVHHSCICLYTYTCGRVQMLSTNGHTDMPVCMPTPCLHTLYTCLRASSAPLLLPEDPQAAAQSVRFQNRWRAHQAQCQRHFVQCSAQFWIQPWMQHETQCKSSSLVQCREQGKVQLLGRFIAKL